MLPSISLGRLLYSLLSLGCLTLSLSWPIIVPSLPRRILTIPSHSSDSRTPYPLFLRSLGRLLYSLFSLGRLTLSLPRPLVVLSPLPWPIVVPLADCCTLSPSADSCITLSLIRLPYPLFLCQLLYPLSLGRLLYPLP